MDLETKVDLILEELKKIFGQIDDKFENIDKRFEAEQSAKIDYLLEADKDCKDYQKIYAHEFTKLNDLVAKNSYRISNLEQHFN